MCDEKQFATLRAQLALHGHTLARTNAADGPERFYSALFGVPMCLSTLEDVQRHLDQVAKGRATVACVAA